MEYFKKLNTYYAVNQMSMNFVIVVSHKQLALQQ